ncbi:transposase, partial [Thiolapillus sp.]|uniref:transposase n=1 Tax=Thiolapillus sp. TaxID=2017437 RepID=UPI003AF67107
DIRASNAEHRIACIMRKLPTWQLEPGKHLSRCPIFGVHLYHSWERGQNENANGLLRQYFPKAMELLDVTTKQVLEAVHKLNSRPRKCLGFKTPYEMFKELTGIDMKNLMGYALIT